MMPGPLQVALVQASPVHVNLEATLDKVESLTRDAAALGSRLVVFGETFIAGYPAWIDSSPGAALWDHAATKEAYAQLRRNSPVIPGPETDRLGTLARELQIVLVIGAHERVDSGPGAGTLYNALLTFGTDGAMLNHHRKLVPTYTERLLWGQGDADGVKVVETEIGRLSGLICWEHWMPLPRQALHSFGEDIHIAAWPTVHEMLQIASRHYAFEGRCYVLAVGTLMKVSDLPAGLPPTDDLARTPGAYLVRGGSCIIGPDGKFITQPLFEEERTITATLDPLAIDRERMTLDVAGHYARPDLFEWNMKDNSRD